MQYAANAANMRCKMRYLEAVFLVVGLVLVLSGLAESRYRQIDIVQQEMVR